MRCNEYLAFAFLASTVTFAVGAEPKLGFKPAGEGLFEFDTGCLKGRLKVDGKYQGLYPLLDSASDMQLVHPPGVFSFYRVLTTNGRYGNAARDWPTTVRLRADGAVEVQWPSAEEHPVEMTGIYRWTAPGTLDLDISATPKRDMPRFELFLSSYFTRPFLASVYLKDEPGSGKSARFVPVNRTASARGRYVMFPRDEAAIAMIRDGRWKIPPNPVDWDIERWLAAPIAIRRDRSSGIAAVMMSRPEDCFAVASPWNPATPDERCYRSLYLCLFGRDVRAGQTVRTSCRLILARDVTDRQALEFYEAYLKASAKPRPNSSSAAGR